MEWRLDSPVWRIKCRTSSGKYMWVLYQVSQIAFLILVISGHKCIEPINPLLVGSWREEERAQSVVTDRYGCAGGELVRQDHPPHKQGPVPRKPGVLLSLTHRVLCVFALFWFGPICLWRQLCYKGSALSTEATKHWAYEACSFQTTRGLVQAPLATDAATLRHNSDVDAVNGGAPSSRRNEMYNAAAYTEASPRASFVTGESLPH